MIVAGDIGGTKARLALIEPLDSGLNIVREETYGSGEFPSRLLESSR
jgi:Glucokinase